MRIRLSRLFQAPAARVIARDGEVTRLALDGLVCDRMCAARARSSLQRLPGVRAASVDFTAATALVEGAALPAAAYDRALRRAAVAMPLRRLLARCTPSSRRCGTGSERTAA